MADTFSWLDLAQDEIANVRDAIELGAPDLAMRSLVAAMDYVQRSMVAGVQRAEWRS